MSSFLIFSLMTMMMMMVMILCIESVFSDTVEFDGGESCYSAASFDRSATTVTAPSTGTITGIRVSYNSGSVTCATGEAGSSSNFGCTSNTYGSMFMVALYKVTDASSSPIAVELSYPTSTSSQDVTDFETLSDTCANADGCSRFQYKITGQGVSDQQMAITGPEYQVSEGDEFLFVFTEAFSGESTGDNQGTACAQVYFVYDAQCW